MFVPESSPVENKRPQTIADILRERRLELGLSRAELARYVAPNCQPSDIDVLESHRMLMPSWIRLRQLAEALEVPVDELLPSDGHAPDDYDSSSN
jgi:transcriptional regulator with XRE-family HTH domain